MASYTPNLNLLKKDPVADGNDFFNIKTMLNDNWDKIDESVKAALDDIGDLQSEQVRIATGSYVGTGTYGASNPCSLTFDFAPKLLIVAIEDQGYLRGMIGYRPQSMAFAIALWSGDVFTQWENNSVKFYDNDGMFNSKNTQYHYLAIG